MQFSSIHRTAMPPWEGQSSPGGGTHPQAWQPSSGGALDVALPARRDEVARVIVQPVVVQVVDHEASGRLRERQVPGDRSTTPAAWVLTRTNLAVQHASVNE